LRSLPSRHAPYDSSWEGFHGAWCGQAFLNAWSLGPHLMHEGLFLLDSQVALLACL